MFHSKVRCLGIALSVFVLVIGGATALWSSLPHAYAADAKDSKLKALLKEKLGVLQAVALQTTNAYQTGVAPFAQVLEANQAVTKAELELCDTEKERLAVLEKMLADAKQYEKHVAEQVQSGQAPAASALKARVNRLDAEIALERAKSK